MSENTTVNELAAELGMEQAELLAFGGPVFDDPATWHGDSVVTAEDAAFIREAVRAI